jgi:5'-nucleotidase
MKILLTNDDGIESAGLKSLAARLSEEHEVWIVAPDSERSGSSHSITLRMPIQVRKKNIRTFACAGTPVDCVILGVLKLVGGDVDICISGPNRGYNLGTDLLYSGTAAAARQSVLMGIPAIAASLASPLLQEEMPPAIEFLARNLNVFKNLSSSDYFLNINFPADAANPMKTSITFPTLRIYKDDIITDRRKGGVLHCTIGGAFPESRMTKGSDGEAIAAGMVSISPIYVHPLNHKIEEMYQTVSLWTGREA